MCLAETILRYNCILFVTPLDLHLFEGRQPKMKNCMRFTRMPSDSKNILRPQGGERVLPQHTVSHLLSPDLHLSLPLPSCKTRLFSEM